MLTSFQSKGLRHVKVCMEAGPGGRVGQNASGLKAM